jgi:uncharacterized protein
MENSKRTFATWIRWLHIYLSMFSFAALLFFAVTGITLNHMSWFDGQQKVEHVNGSLPVNWVQTDSVHINKLMVVERLRQVHQIKYSLSDFSIQDTECSVSFKGPGYNADGFIDRTSGKYELTITKSGLIAVMNDLHKGRDTGTTWLWLIDVSALLMIVVSLTGFLMIFFLKKRRLNGLLVAAAGVTIIILISLL